jgi:hypothetical protein
MDDKERNQFVDSLLGASLARYSRVAPQPGLEGRILANVAAAQERRTWSAWVGWLAAGAAAAMIIVGVFNLAHRPAIPAPPKSAELVKGPQVKGPGLVAVRPERARAHLPASKRRARQVNLVLAREENRLPMFPSPGTMTEQERLLAQYVHTTPAEVLSAASTEIALIPDLEIKPLEIAPLDTDETEPKINQ